MSFHRTCQPLLVMALVLLGTAAAADEAAELRQLVETLSQRVDQLTAEQLRDRQQLQRLKQLDGLAVELVAVRDELQLFTRHIHSQAPVTDQLIRTRADIDSLSQEMSLMKELTSDTAAHTVKDKSQGTVIHWLQDMVSMLRTQMTDISESFNITEWLQLKETTGPRFEALQGEVRFLQDSLEQVEIHRRTDRSRLKQLQADLVQQSSHDRNAEKTYTTLQEQVSTMRAEMADTAAPPRLIHSRTHHKRGRHHRSHRSQDGHRRSRTRRHFHMRALENIVDVLYRKQSVIDDQLGPIQGNVSSLVRRQVAADSQRDETTERLDALERKQKLLSWRVNVSLGSDALHNIQTSSMDLIREVDAVESKFDRELLALKTELTRLDVSCGQLGSVMHQVQDQQKRIPEIGKQLKQDMAELSQTGDENRASLLALRSHVLSRKLQCCTTPIDGTSGVPTT